MKRELTINKKTLIYSLKRCNLSKNLRISLFPGPEVVVTLPIYCSYRKADNFVIENFDKIIERVSNQREHQPLKLIYRDLDFPKNKEKARVFITKILTLYAPYYGFKYTTVTIRNQSTRWGSCSSKGRLNFNFKLMFLPLRLAEYVVIHELCHLKEMNHSDKFWKLVAKIFPNYKELSKELKEY